jgi:c-di-GMP-binding flagellar brake protein YcgR
MTKSAAASLNYDYKDEAYKSPAGILLHSRTVVEKDGFVSTGLLTYAEGDIIEVEIPEYKLFNLGDSVKITAYSPGGIYTFLSTIVAKHKGALIIINPPHNQRRFVEKRESPRVQVNQKGSLHTITWLDSEGKQKLNDSIGLTVQNISVSGIGFALSNDDLDLSSAFAIEAELDLGVKVPIVAEIIRRENLFEGYYYGARYVGMESEKVTSIRAFVLKMQVESYFKEKELKELKREFK